MPQHENLHLSALGMGNASVSGAFYIYTSKERTKALCGSHDSDASQTRCLQGLTYITQLFQHSQSHYKRAPLHNVFAVTHKSCTGHQINTYHRRCVEYLFYLQGVFTCMVTDALYCGLYTVSVINKWVCLH